MPSLEIYNIRRRSRRFKAPAEAKLLLNALCLSALIYMPTALADEAEYQKIRFQMNKLARLIGKWNVAVTFHHKDSVTEEVGTWSVTSVLDDTYLEFQTERHLKDNPKRSAKVIWYTTFNPRSNRYETTYFYNRWAMRVTETGEYDEATQEFRTRGFIPLEDGVNDETVRTITSLKDPNKIVYTHYSMRSPAETCQRIDVEMILTHVR
jgi:Protein of unknown function (DUF1579)